MSSSRGRKLKPKSISPTTVTVTPSKKKRPNTSVAAVPIKVEPEIEITPVVSREESPVPAECPDKIPIFKDKKFVHSSVGTNSGSKKTRVWKNLKQIIATEKSQPWKPDDVTYNSIDAPPSFRPAKKYSDLSGLAAKYTDPQTKLRYATSEEYSRIKLMPSDLVSGCLALRKANAPVP